MQDRLIDTFARFTAIFRFGSNLWNTKINIFLKKNLMRITTQSGTRWLGALMIGLPLIFSASARANELQILLVLSNSSPPYQAFSNAFTKNLPASIQTRVLQTPNELTGNRAPADLIVAVGMKATEAATLQSALPILSVMVPQAGYEALIARSAPLKHPQSIAAIYLNQPWDRQLDFLFAILPERRKVGVLCSPATQKDIAYLREEVAAHGGTLIEQTVYSAATLFADLEKVLQGSDVLLALPDSAIYSSSSVRNILLSTYRLHVPLIGWSQGYVNAGAVAALFSTPEQLAEQTAATVHTFSQTGRWPGAQYPNTFTIAVNQQVARSLGIDLKSDEEIRAQMRRNRRGGRD